MASTKMKLGFLKKSSPTSVSKTISKEASPDSKCPICLDKFRNISYVDKCLHRFCFRCIHEWSKNKAECPLCKQPFRSIYHSIKAEDDFKQYDLRPTDNGSFGNLSGQRFRYRTTLTAERRAERRTSPPPDHGVMFEGLSGSTSRGNDRGFHRMLVRLEARHRLQREGRTLRTLHEQEMIQFRRTLYRRGLWVRGVRDGGRSRETSAEFFRGNPACLHRLVPWLKRELTILYGTHGSLVNIVQHIVMSQITRYDMQNPAVLQELRPFLLSRTEHFLHEFQSFAQSPFNMEAYDQNAVYDCPAPSAEDRSGSDSSIITVSEDELGVDTNVPGARNQTISAILSQTPWDDETPGPSYSTDPPRVFTVSVTSSDSDSEEDEEGPSTSPAARSTAQVKVEERSSIEEDCVIVGYVKPTAERTPELVHLSSDSEEEETENIQVSQPQHIRFTSPPDSPTNSATSSQSAAREKSTHKLTTSNRNRTSQSCDSRPASPRCLSKNLGRKNEDDRRHSKSKWKDRSRNRDRESSSHSHRRRSHSKDRKRAERISSYHPSRAHHSYEKDSSSRYYKHAHYSSGRFSPDKYIRSYARSRERSHARSRVHSRDHSHVHSRERSHSRSRSRSWSYSRDRKHSRTSHRKHDKPGGKRKYKLLHLEPSTAETTGCSAQEKKRSKEKREKKQRSSRSLSVEIVCEGEESRKKHHKKRKKHKKRNKRKRSKERREMSSPAVITINSESDSDEDGNDTDLHTGSNANDADSASIPPHSPEEPSQVSRTHPEPEEPSQVSGTHPEPEEPSQVSGTHPEPEEPSQVSGTHPEPEEPSQVSRTHPGPEEPSQVSRTHPGPEQPSQVFSLLSNIAEPFHLSRTPTDPQ